MLSNLVKGNYIIFCILLSFSACKQDMAAVDSHASNNASPTVRISDKPTATVTTVATFPFSTQTPKKIPSVICSPSPTATSFQKDTLTATLSYNLDLDAKPLTSGFEPVTSNNDWIPDIQVLTGVEMALVPVGCFNMGSTDEQIDDAMQRCEELRGAGNCYRRWYQDEQPVTKHCFDEPFWIDVYEVTNLQYGSSGEWSEDTLPRERVSWVEAANFCKNRGARLPSELEWEYAARGPDGLKFPWGDIFDRSLVNSCDKSCFFNRIGTRVDDGYVNTAPVGSFVDGASWVGAMDMSGNVWEWTNSIFMDYPYNAFDGREEDVCINDCKRVMRGGSWFHSGSDLLRSAARYEVSPAYSDYVLGFRCVIGFSDATISDTE